MATAKENIEENINPSILSKDVAVCHAMEKDSHWFAPAGTDNNYDIMQTHNLKGMLNIECYKHDVSNDEKYETVKVRDGFSNISNCSLLESSDSWLTDCLNDAISFDDLDTKLSENYHCQNNEENSEMLESLNIDNNFSENSSKCQLLETGKEPSGSNMDVLLPLETPSASNELSGENIPFIVSVEKCSNLFCDCEVVEYLDFTKLEDMSEIANGESIENQCDISEKGNQEIFQDAVQFFTNDSSFEFLETIKTTNKKSSFLRNSLYIKFDPLYKTSFEPCIQDSLPLIAKSEKDPSIVDSEEDLDLDKVVNDCLILSSIPIYGASPRESFGNIMSFDSPEKNNYTKSLQELDNIPANLSRLYTEEEFNQAIKLHELTIQETFLKEQRKLEFEDSKRIEEKEEKISQKIKTCNYLRELVEEFVSLLEDQYQKSQHLTSRIVELETEAKKLNGDLTSSSKDFQNAANTFGDFRKRYEQSKIMLKTYKDNEDKLRQQVENLHKKLEEQEEIYDSLQSSTENMVNQANAEIANARREGNAQVTLLKAQLKKSELKISSLESNLEQVRTENNKLSVINADLIRNSY